jgi:hypothetical protein
MKSPNTTERDDPPLFLISTTKLTITQLQRELQGEELPLLQHQGEMTYDPTNKRLGLKQSS